MGYPNARQCTQWTRDAKPSRYAIAMQIYERKRLRKQCQPLINELSEAVDLGRISAQW